MNEHKKTQTLVMIALMTSLVAAVTMVVNIPIPTVGGYLNLGDVAVMISAIIMPIRGALIASSVGSALADLLSSAPSYTVFTFFIKGIEAFIVYKSLAFFGRRQRFFSFLLASFVMAVLYGLVDAFFSGSLRYMPISLMYNSIQALLSSIIMTLIYPYIIRLKEHLRG